MSMGLGARLAPYVVQVSRPADPTRRIGSSGYLVSPGKIITALHSVLDTNQFTSVPSLVKCHVRTVADIEAKYSFQAWDPEFVSNEIDALAPSPSIWREAKLVWPLSGSSTRRLDVALIEVDFDRCTPAMRSAPQVAFFAPNDAVGCIASGFADWKQKRLLGGQLLIELHEVRGRLFPTKRLTDTMNDFRVDTGSPSASQSSDLSGRSPWSGLSGAVLFDEESGLAVGVVGRWEDSSDLSVLGVTLMSKVADTDKLWALAGLTKPIRRTADIRRFAIQSQTARELVHLVNREDQIKRWNEKLAPKATEIESQREQTREQSKWAPVVIMMVSRPRDLSAELVRRFERYLATIHSGRRFLYAAIPRLSFPKTVDDAEKGESFLIAELADKLALPVLAAKLRSSGRVDDEAISELRCALGYGIMPRAFQIEIILSKVSPAAPDILSRFIASWSKLGELDTPAIALIALLTQDYDSDALAFDESSDAILVKLEESLPRLTAGPIWVRLPPLKDCSEQHLETWTIDLENESFKVPYGFCDDIRRHLEMIIKKEPETFSMRDLLFALDSLRI